MIERKLTDSVFFFLFTLHPAFSPCIFILYILSWVHSCHHVSFGFQFLIFIFPTFKELLVCFFYSFYLFLSIVLCFSLSLFTFFAFFSGFLSTFFWLFNMANFRLFHFSFYIVSYLFLHVFLHSAIRYSRSVKILFLFRPSYLLWRQFVPFIYLYFALPLHSFRDSFVLFNVSLIHSLEVLPMHSCSYSAIPLFRYLFAN